MIGLKFWNILINPLQHRSNSRKTKFSRQSQLTRFSISISTNHHKNCDSHNVTKFFLSQSQQITIKFVIHGVNRKSNSHMILSYKKRCRYRQTTLKPLTSSLLFYLCVLKLMFFYIKVFYSHNKLWYKNFLRHNKYFIT